MIKITCEELQPYPHFRAGKHRPKACVLRIDGEVALWFVEWDGEMMERVARAAFEWRVGKLRGPGESFASVMRRVWITPRSNMIVPRLISYDV